MEVEMILIYREKERGRRGSRIDCGELRYIVACAIGVGGSYMSSLG